MKKEKIFQEKTTPVLHERHFLTNTHTQYYTSSDKPTYTIHTYIDKNTTTYFQCESSSNANFEHK